MAEQKIAHGVVTAAHWVDGKYSAQEVTLEITHADGRQTLLVVPVLRMTATGQLPPKPAESAS